MRAVCPGEVDVAVALASGTTPAAPEIPVSQERIAPVAHDTLRTAPQPPSAFETVRPGGLERRGAFLICEIRPPSTSWVAVARPRRLVRSSAS